MSFKDMIDGVQGYDISLPNSYLKSFRYILKVFRTYYIVNRTTADVRLHNRCCASVAQLLCGCRSGVVRLFTSSLVEFILLRKPPFLCLYTPL